jgi:6-phosphofructokinase 2
MVLKQLENYLLNNDYLIVSGKLPPGIPNDFYTQVAAIAERKKHDLF